MLGHCFFYLFVIANVLRFGFKQEPKMFRKTDVGIIQNERRARIGPGIPRGSFVTDSAVILGLMWNNFEIILGPN